MFGLEARYGMAEAETTKEKAGPSQKSEIPFIVRNTLISTSASQE
jgi:hypothetical protein